MDLSVESILHRQKVFISTLKLHLLRKIAKYQNILVKQGIHLTGHSGNTDDIHSSIPKSQSFEDHIQLVLGQKSASPSALKTFWKVGNRISTNKLFRWIYLIVQRTKAARILHHLDGVSDSQIQVVIQSVGQELAVAYEYQLCMLYGDLEIVKLAQHAGSCILTYLNSADTHFAPENLLQAILEVKPHSSANRENLKTRSFFFNGEQVCLTWRLSQILKQPGLRITDTDVYDESKSVVAKQAEATVENNEDRVVMPTAATDRNTNKKDNTDTTKEIDRLDGLTLVDISSYDDKLDQNDGFNSNGKFRRHISAVEMDFEKGEMTVTEYSVEVSDFSPVLNASSTVSNGSSTSLEEDLIFDNCNAISDINNTNNNQRDEICENETSFQNNDSIAKEGNAEAYQTDADDNNSVSENEDIENIELNANRNFCQKLTDKKENVSVQNEVITEGTASVMNNKLIQSEGAHNTCTPNEHIKQDRSLQTIHTKQETSTQLAINSKQEVSYSKTISSNDVKSSTNVKNNYSISAKISHDSNDYLAENLESTKSQHDCSGHINEETYHEYSLPSNHIIPDNDFDDCDSGLSPELIGADENYSFYGCFTPFGAKCRPHIYGYRGPLHVWNENKKEFTLIYNDIVTVAGKHVRQLINDPSDFHQLYVPKTKCRHET